MGKLKKYGSYIITFFVSFICVTLCQPYSITSLVLLKISNCGIRKMMIFCTYDCFNVPHYIKGGRKLNKIALKTIAFLTQMFV